MKTVVYVHGMGTGSKGFSKPLSKRVARKTSTQVVESIWSAEVDSRQAALWKRVRKQVGNAFGIRKNLVIEGFGDALATLEDGDQAFAQAERKVADDIMCAAKTGEVIVVAHSLGTWLVESAFCDKPELLDSVSGLVTMGSPLPLFKLARTAKGSVGIPWLNLWAKFDPIAFPLRAALPSVYNHVVDVKVPALPIVAHTAYWRKLKVSREISSFVKDPRAYVKAKR